MNTSSAGNEIVIQPVSDAYDPSDSRWLNQVQGLLSSLQSNGGIVRKEVTPVAGQKGGAVEIILALGTAGALPVVADIIKAWLNRDGTRSIEISTTTGGEKKKIKVTGKNISKELLAEALQQAAK